MYFVGFLLDAALAVAMTAMPFFVYKQLGGAEAMSGFFGGFAGAGYAVTCIILARFVSRADNILHWAAAGMGIYTALFIAILSSRNPWICGTLYTLAFCSMALVWPALHAWIGSDPDPDQRKRHTGWFNVAWSLGMSAGPLLAGPLIDWHYGLSFIAVVLLTLSSLLLLLTLPHENRHFARATEEQLDARQAHDRLSEAHLVSAWCATLTVNSLMGLARNVFPKRVDDLVASGQLRFFAEDTVSSLLTANAATKFSWLAFVVTLASAGAFLAAGHTTRWRHNFTWLAFMQMASGGAFWYLGHTCSLVGMLLAFAVFGAASGQVFFASLTYSLADPARKHGRATMNEAMVGAGGFVGSIVAGSAVSYWGFERPFQWMPVCILSAVLLQWGLLIYGRRKTSAAHS